MHPVIDVIFLCHFTGQLNLNRFHPKFLPFCSGNSSIALPALPADILDMCPVLDSTGVCCIFKADFQSFHPLCGAGHTAG